jgi:hypothetical protein
MSKHDKLQVSDEEALSFIEPAMHIVDSRIRNLNGEPLEDEQRVRAIMRVSENMAAGSLWTRGRYLLTGGVIGALYFATGLLCYSIGKGKES